MMSRIKPRRPASRFLCLDDFEPAARRRLPRPLFGYIQGAAERGASKEDNARAYAELRLLPRMLAGVSGRSIATRVLGQDVSGPFGIAPMGISALMAHDGDRGLARAARDAGIPFILSGSSLTRVEDVLETNPDTWFQIYVPGETDVIVPLVQRARSAGVRTLVVTVNTAVLANRENNVRAGFSTPLRLTPRLVWDVASRPRWLAGCFARTIATSGMPHFENSTARRGAPILSSTVMRDFGAKDALDWSHIARIRAEWDGKLVIKGLLHPDDTARAAVEGCDGVILSNHGGRQLDGAVSPLRVLPENVAAAGEMDVMIDGGIRRGTDVMKALALGARCAFIGRPFLYAAAVSGRNGAARAIEIMKDEIFRDAGLMGINDLLELAPDHLISR